MPFAARLRRLCWYASIQWSRSGPPRLMSSCTGTLSTTDHVSAEASISFFRPSMACAVQACPFGTSCSAVTIPVAPVCRMSANVMGSLGPNHRHVCSMNCLLSLIAKAIALRKVTSTLRKDADAEVELGLTQLAGLGEDGRDHDLVRGKLGIEGLEHEAHRLGQRSASERDEIRGPRVRDLGATTAQVAHPGGDGSHDPDGEPPGRAFPAERGQDADRQLLRAVPGDLVEPVRQARVGEALDERRSVGGVVSGWQAQMSR